MHAQKCKRRELHTLVRRENLEGNPPDRQQSPSAKELCQQIYVRGVLARQALSDLGTLLLETGLLKTTEFSGSACGLCSSVVA